MLTVDAHCHAGLDWMEPIEALLFEMDRNAVDRAVLTQFVRLFDHTYLLDCVRRYPGRFAVIGAVDNTRATAVTTLERWAARGVQGIRIRLMDVGGMTQLPAVLVRCAELGLKLSCYGTQEDYASAEFRALIERSPGVPVIIEHFGFADFTASPPFGKFERILSLAEYPNVYMKLHGLGEYLPRPPAAKHPPFDLDALPPCIDMAIEAFGSRRIMMGTDWPESAPREGYGNVVRYVRQYLLRRAPAEQAAILGGTAASLFTFAWRGRQRRGALDQYRSGVSESSLTRARSRCPRLRSPRS